MEQLEKTPALISILELLCLSPSHKTILDQALQEASVPTNLNTDQFQAMVGSLKSSPCLTFFESDNSSFQQPHNALLHIEGFINQHRIKRVLIDNGAGLNICALQLVTALGYAIESVDPRKKITIKAYDDAEHSSKGAVVLPIRVGPVVKHIICQVLKLPLPYNLLLGRPWIHAMQAIPSTYHQCIKFPHNGVEITILGDANPFAYCHNISHQPEITVPNNREAISSTSYISPASLASLNTTIPKQEKLKIKIAEEGPGEYNLSQLFCVGQTPTSPRTHGKPQQVLQQPLNMPACSLMPFILGKSQEEETQDEDLVD